MFMHLKTEFGNTWKKKKEREKNPQLGPDIFKPLLSTVEQVDQKNQ